ncbi:unnamed protein product, partial [Amoebophrya sp. A25]
PWSRQNLWLVSKESETGERRTEYLARGLRGAMMKRTTGTRLQLDAFWAAFSLDDFCKGITVNDYELESSNSGGAFTWSSASRARTNKDRNRAFLNEEDWEEVLPASGHREDLAITRQVPICAGPKEEGSKDDLTGRFVIRPGDQLHVSCDFVDAYASGEEEEQPEGVQHVTLSADHGRRNPATTVVRIPEVKFHIPPVFLHSAAAGGKPKSLKHGASEDDEEYQLSKQEEIATGVVGNAAGRRKKKVPPPKLRLQYFFGEDGAGSQADGLSITGKIDASREDTPWCAAGEDDFSRSGTVTTTTSAPVLQRKNAGDANAPARLVVFPGGPTEHPNFVAEEH